MDDEILIRSGERRGCLTHCGDLKGAYEDEELAEILRQVPDPVFFGLDYSDLAFLNGVLMEIADAEDVLIEDGAGKLSRGSDLVQRLRQNPELDWRQVPGTPESGIEIVVSRPADLSRFTRLLQPPEWTLKARRDDQVDVWSNGQRIRIKAHDPIVNVLQDEELAAIRSHIPDPEFFGLGYRDLPLLNRVLLQIADADDVLVRYGWAKLTRGRDLVRHLRKNPDLAWLTPRR